MAHMSVMLLFAVLTAVNAASDPLEVLRKQIAVGDLWLGEIRAEQTVSESASLLQQTERERFSLPPKQIGPVTVTVDGETVVFADVDASAWFAPYVKQAADERIISGYRDAEGKPTGAFGPQDPVTIAELAKISVLASGTLPSQCAKKPKNPLAQEGWFTAVLSCAEQAQWVLFSDGTVDPLRPALRGEVIVTVLQALGAPQPKAVQEAPFTDVTPSTQFAASIAQAKFDGIVQGYTDESGMPTGLFGPQDRVTRAETAKILMTALRRYR